MYSFTPTEEQKMLVDAISRYASQDLRPKAHDAEEELMLPPNLLEKGWELGYLQASIPEQYGGFGERSAVTGVLAAEELAWGDLAGALAIMLPGLYATPILLAGTEEQKQQFLAPVIEAEWQPYTAALIEPTFDFDPNDLRTVAVESDDGYVIHGSKTFVPYADQAQGMVVYAKLNGVTQGFVVPKGAAGVEIADRQKLMGLNALPVYRVNFNDLHLPVDHRLGGGQGHEFAPILDSMNVALAALSVGLSRAAYEFSRDYAKERDVFGVKVAQKQAIAFMLAEMATEIEAIRLLTWEAAWMQDAGKEDASKHAYLALTGATDMAMMVTDRAVQILGGHGYIREYPVELWMRNGRGIATFNGLAIV
jgi:alkylation response protein AidB-like acyl-CoA dehydrogenase